MPAVPLGPTDQLLRAAEEQSRGEQMLRQVLDAAMKQPHTVTRISTLATGLRSEGQQTILMVATPDGRRLDIELSRPAAVALARNLVPAEQQAA